MARYELLMPAYIGMTVRQKGEVVEVPDDTIPGPYMKPIDPAATKAFLAIRKLGFKAPMRKMDDMELAAFEVFDIGELADAR